MFELARNRIGRRTFVGNSAVIPVGHNLGNGCLLGVNSLAPLDPRAGGAKGSAGAASDRRTAPDGTEWLGSPAFPLAHRPRVGNFTEEEIFRPSRKMYAQRAVIDAFRVLIPSYISAGKIVAGMLLLNACLEHFGLAVMMALVPAIQVALDLGSMLVVVALKKLLMGTFKPAVQPLWSMYVWLNEVINGVYESIMAPALGRYLGTPFCAPLLRLCGCKIGRHVYVGTTFFSEFDLVEVGDHAALNAGSVIQTHLFEDRVMKSSHLKIGTGCSVGNMSVVLYDSELQDGAELGPLSLVMKGEILPAHERWQGIPCTPEDQPALSSAAAA
jgi:non-ribosomal peptide synthetase-like protein